MSSTAVQIKQGGTGQVTANAAMNAILPSKTGNSLKVLRVNSGETDYELATISGGSPGGSTKEVQYNNTGVLGGATGFEVGNTDNRVLIHSQSATEIPLILKGHASQSGDFFSLRNSANADLIKWNSSGDLSVYDRITSYFYSGEIRGGWHPTQIGFCVSPTWGYGFSNANNFNTIDASIMRSGAGVIKIIAGGLGSSTLGDLEVLDEAYGVSWNGSNEVPTKNAVYDKIETLSAGSGLTFAETMRLKTILNNI